MKKLHVDKSNAMVGIVDPKQGYVCSFCRESKWLVCPIGLNGSGICSECAGQVEELLKENTPFEGQV